jgi:hypothetical protein
MNCREANEKISIVDFLFSIGIEPKRVAGNNYWYLSPFRNENTPSLKINTEFNRWYDHGLGIGGKLVDLGTRFYETDISAFLQRIEGWDFSKSFSLQKPVQISEQAIRKIRALENKALLDYMLERGISVSQAKNYCTEIYYEVGGKNYFAIAFKNDSDGYEVRNKYFKACLLKKDITSIIRPDAKKLIITEGFIDFLSLFKIPSINLDSTSFIILNSVTQIDKAKTKMVELNPLQIEAFFDNDDAGRRCFESLKQDFPAAIDRSNLYQRFKDLNEMLVKKKERTEERSL